jgi:cytochrome c
MNLPTLRTPDCRRLRRHAAPLALALLTSCAATNEEAATPRYGFGRSVDAPEIALWDSDVTPDGRGLPPGQGRSSAGAGVYQLKCAACHGSEGQGGPNDRLVAPYEPGINHSLGTVPRSIGNYWPYATTLFDYVRRAMPHNAPGSLSDQEVYDLTAWLLYRNGVIDADTLMSQQSLPQVRMPAQPLFYWSDEAPE